jgi:hypothetical protein
MVLRDHGTEVVHPFACQYLAAGEGFEPSKLPCLSTGFVWTPKNGHTLGYGLRSTSHAFRPNTDNTLQFLQRNFPSFTYGN